MEGVDDLIRALKKAGELGPTALASAMVVEQEGIIALGKQNIPVDKGVARASGTVLPPEISGTTITVVSGYGGAAKEYIIPLHEDLTKRHTVGRAKWHESAANERKAGMGKRLAAGVGKALARLGK